MTFKEILMSEDQEFVKIAHGAGGKLQNSLIDFITKDIKNKKLGSDGIGVEEMDDGAVIPEEFITPGDLVVTADGHTIFPLNFPGGNLGKLSICGCVNDLLMMGARPLALTSVVLLEEGLPFLEIKKQMDSFNFWAAEANVAIIAGDTKVMPRGTLNGMVIVTTGVGVRPKNRKISDNSVCDGDAIIVSGPVGDHGASLIANREGISLETDLISDVALLSDSVKSIIDVEIHAMKDVTRGGLSAALNEWAKKSNVGIVVDENVIPIRKETAAVCKILGLDPLDIACEGRFIIAVPNSIAESIIQKLKKTDQGKDAVIIGYVNKEKLGKVLMKTNLGGTRIIEHPTGEPIPRIC
jgi:hydrogenase expression/formation protein HypE